MSKQVLKKFESPLLRQQEQFTWCPAREREREMNAIIQEMTSSG